VPRAAIVNARGRGTRPRIPATNCEIFIASDFYRPQPRLSQSCTQRRIAPVARLILFYLVLHSILRAPPHIIQFNLDVIRPHFAPSRALLNLILFRRVPLYFARSDSSLFYASDFAFDFDALLSLSLSLSLSSLLFFISFSPSARRIISSRRYYVPGAIKYADYRDN